MATVTTAHSKATFAKCSLGLKSGVFNWYHPAQPYPKESGQCNYAHVNLPQPTVLSLCALTA